MTSNLRRPVLKTLRIAALLLVTVAASAGVWAGYLRLTGNFHEVAPGCSIVRPNSMPVA